VPEDRRDLELIARLFVDAQGEVQELLMAAAIAAKHNPQSDSTWKLIEVAIGKLKMLQLHEALATGMQTRTVPRDHYLIDLTRAEARQLYRAAKDGDAPEALITELAYAEDGHGTMLDSAIDEHD
jgi:hypothetical protein